MDTNSTKQAISSLIVAVSVSYFPVPEYSPLSISAYDLETARLERRDDLIARSLNITHAFVCLTFLPRNTLTPYHTNAYGL